jgi:pimeloyl-ACP methyl ester carboxylesterase
VQSNGFKPTHKPNPGKTHNPKHGGLKSPSKGVAAKLRGMLDTAHDQTARPLCRSAILGHVQSIKRLYELLQRMVSYQWFEGPKDGVSSEMIRTALFIGLLAGMATATAGEILPAPKETVVLLHGMGRSRLSMLVLKSRLEKAGYAVLNFPYAPPLETLDAITRDLDLFLREKVRTDCYHLVGHSLGNIVIRNAFKHEMKPGLGRVVMLAPPNRPAYLAAELKDVDVYKWLTGDSGQKLSSEEFYRTLPVPDVAFGIIAGDRGQRFTFDEPNDGIITVESTKLDGMKDWILLHHTHTFMMNSKDTAAQCIHFLQTGAFAKPDKASPKKHSTQEE